MDQGQPLPATSCAKCGSTNRGPYFNRRDLAGVCVLTGKPYTSIIIRRTRCQDCGQQRDDLRPLAFGYLRVSTDEQARKGLSLAAQQRLVWDHFRLCLRPQGFRWGGWFRERGVSARTHRFFRRPAAAALHALLAPGSMIVAARIDRIWRRLADFADTMEVWTRMDIQVRALDIGQLDLPDGRHRRPDGRGRRPPLWRAHQGGPPGAPSGGQKN